VSTLGKALWSYGATLQFVDNRYEITVGYTNQIPDLINLLSPVHRAPLSLIEHG